MRVGGSELGKLLNCFAEQNVREDLTRRAGSCKYGGLRSAGKIEEKTWDLQRTRFTWARSRIHQRARWSRRSTRHPRMCMKSLGRPKADTTTRGRIIRTARRWSAPWRNWKADTRRMCLLRG